MHDRKDAKPRKPPRKHPVNQLQTRPLTIPTCAGVVTVSAKRNNGQMLGVVESPEGIDVTQAPKGVNQD